MADADRLATLLDQVREQCRRAQKEAEQKRAQYERQKAISLKRVAERDCAIEALEKILEIAQDREAFVMMGPMGGRWGFLRAEQIALAALKEIRGG